MRNCEKRKRVAALLDSCRDRPDLFNELFLNRPAYWSRQKDLCRSVVEYRTTVAYSGNMVGKDTKFINCRIGPFWRAVWLVIWAVRKRIFQLLAGSRDDYQVSSAGGGGDVLYLFHSERTPASSVCRIGGPQTRTWRHCLRRSTPQLSSKDH